MPQSHPSCAHSSSHIPSSVSRYPSLSTIAGSTWRGGAGILGSSNIATFKIVFPLFGWPPRDHHTSTPCNTPDSLHRESKIEEPKRVGHYSCTVGAESLDAPPATPRSMRHPDPSIRSCVVFALGFLALHSLPLLENLPAGCPARHATLVLRLLSLSGCAR